MSTDFETRLAELLNESVDAQVGTRPAAPPFTPSSITEAGDELAARRRRRYTFLAVAATIVAILAAALTLNAVADGSHHRATPATHVPLQPTVHMSARPSPRPSTQPTTHPTTKPVTTPPTHPSTQNSTKPAAHSRTTQPVSRPKSVRLGAASIALPEGWVARRFPKAENVGRSSWCLTPRSTPVRVSSNFNRCPIIFRFADGVQLDPDFQGGGVGDAEYCDMGRTLVHDSASGDIRDFGGRDAFYFTRKVHCNGIGSVHFAQYEVSGVPATVLYAPRLTSAISSELQLIVTNSRLPAQTSRLWLADLGRITSKTGSGSHVHVTINRVYLNGGVKNPATSIDGQTARYTVTTKQLKYGEALGPIKIGTVVQIDTNGNTVTDISPVN